MAEELLGEIGLSSREIKVYKALLELGLSSVGGIIKKSGIPSSKIYETLDKLIKKGLAGSIIKDNKRKFQASDPKVILGFLDEKRDLIEEELIPKLESLKGLSGEEEATVYEGFKGVKSVWEKMLKVLKRGEIVYVLGASKEGQLMIEPYVANLNKRRIKEGIIMRIIYHSKSRDIGKLREKMKCTEVRYLKEGFISPAWLDLFGDYTVTFDFSKKVPIAFLVKSKAIAQSYKTFFEMIWKQSKP